MVNLENFDIDSQSGIFENAYNILKSKNGIIEIKDLVKYVNFLRDTQMDSHIIFMGQNGVGKSYATMMFLEELGNFKIDNLVAPQDDHVSIMNRLAEQKSENIWIDEIAQIFPYKMSSRREIIELFSAIEVARANRNLIVGCCRDVRRLYNNYRNGKVGVVVWLLERYTGKYPLTVGVVLVANPYIEAEDKFCLENIIPSPNPKLVRIQLEKLPTFVGYIFFPNIKNKINSKLLKDYNNIKQAGINYLIHLKTNKISKAKALKEIRDERIKDKKQ